MGRRKRATEDADKLTETSIKSSYNKYIKELWQLKVTGNPPWFLRRKKAISLVFQKLESGG